jgi:hypothetical protein
MGAPLGNDNANKGKRWKLAIDRALEARSKSEGVEALDRLAEKLLTLADQGDLAALKELGDRIDGKAAQSIAVGNEPGQEFVTKVVREIVHTHDPDSKGL